MEPTLIRQLDATAMVVGASGPNADRITMAFEQARIRVLHLGSAPVATDRIATTMPHVVVLVGPISGEEREHLLDHATAVGAPVLDADPALQGEPFEELVTVIVTTAIQRKLLRDELSHGHGADELSRDSEAAPVSVDVDAGWDL